MMMETQAVTYRSLGMPTHQRHSEVFLCAGQELRFSRDRESVSANLPKGYCQKKARRAIVASVEAQHHYRSRSLTRARPTRLSFNNSMGRPFYFTEEAAMNHPVAARPVCDDPYVGPAARQMRSAAEADRKISPIEERQHTIGNTTDQLAVLLDRLEERINTSLRPAPMLANGKDGGCGDAPPCTSSLAADLDRHIAVLFRLRDRLAGLIDRVEL